MQQATTAQQMCPAPVPSYLQLLLRQAGGEDFTKGAVQLVAPVQLQVWGPAGQRGSEGVLCRLILKPVPSQQHVGQALACKGIKEGGTRIFSTNVLGSAVPRATSRCSPAKEMEVGNVG